MPKKPESSTPSATSGPLTDGEQVVSQRQHEAALQILDGLVYLEGLARDNGLKLLGYLIEMAIHEATDRAEKAGEAMNSH